MEKNVEISLLFSFYKNILTEKQAEAIDLYYNDDLSLSEMADYFKITRQGVRDNIKRAENILYDMEEKLGLVERFLAIKNKLIKIDCIINEIENSDDIKLLSNDVKKKINQILLTISEINEE